MASQTPAAVDHLPVFITPPGQTDVLLAITAVFLIVVVFGVGLLFWRIHSLPEHMAHKSKKIQLEFVAVLTLLSLFTHEHIFWIAALLLAFVELPNFLAPLDRIATSLENIEEHNPQPEPQPESPQSPPAAIEAAEIGSKRLTHA